MAIAVPNLPGKDLEVLRAFYVDCLGFRVVFESSENGHEGIVGIERDGMRINLDCPMDGHGDRACVSIETEDFDTLYAEWSAKVAIPPPIHQPWGVRSFEFQDPDDNTIFVIGPEVRAE